jgi:hypothetical protein
MTMKTLAATIFCFALAAAGLSSCGDDDKEMPNTVDAAVGTGGAGGTAPVGGAGGAGATGGTTGTDTGVVVPTDAGGGDVPAAETGGGTPNEIHLGIINGAPAAGVTALDVPATVAPAYDTCK